jgi:hypothetical protein
VYGRPLRRCDGRTANPPVDEPDALKGARPDLWERQGVIPGATRPPGKKIGNAHLKWAFGEAACLLVRHCEKGKTWLARKEKKHGKAKALAILAAKLGRTVYHLWRKRQVWDESKVFAS